MIVSDTRRGIEAASLRHANVAATRRDLSISSVTVDKELSRGRSGNANFPGAIKYLPYIIADVTFVTFIIIISR